MIPSLSPHSVSQNGGGRLLDCASPEQPQTTSNLFIQKNPPPRRKKERVKRLKNEKEKLKEKEVIAEWKRKGVWERGRGWAAKACTDHISPQYLLLRPSLVFQRGMRLRAKLPSGTCEGGERETMSRVRKGTYITQNTINKREKSDQKGVGGGRE